LPRWLGTWFLVAPAFALDVVALVAAVEQATARDAVTGRPVGSARLGVQ